MTPSSLHETACTVGKSSQEPTARPTTAIATIPACLPTPSKADFPHMGGSHGKYSNLCIEDTAAHHHVQRWIHLTPDATRYFDIPMFTSRRKLYWSVRPQPRLAFLPTPNAWFMSPPPCLFLPLSSPSPATPCPQVMGLLLGRWHDGTAAGGHGGGGAGSCPTVIVDHAMILTR